MGFLPVVPMAEAKKSQKGANQTSPWFLKMKNLSLRDWRFCYVCGVGLFPMRQTRASLLPRSSFRRCGPAVGEDSRVESWYLHQAHKTDGKYGNVVKNWHQNENLL